MWLGRVAHIHLDTRSKPLTRDESTSLFFSSVLGRGGGIKKRKKKKRKRKTAT